MSLHRSVGVGRVFLTGIASLSHLCLCVDWQVGDTLVGPGAMRSCCAKSVAFHEVLHVDVPDLKAGLRAQKKKPDWTS